MLTALCIANYRSLRDLRMPLGRLTLITGANGSGKSSIYRALRLLADAAQNRVLPSLALEGGFTSALWAGPEEITRAMRAGEVPVQGSVRQRPVALKLGIAGDDFGYAIELGLPALSERAASTLFNLDPCVKCEAVWAGPFYRRAAALVERETGAYLGGLGLSRGEFDVLTALRRAGAPQTPGSLRTVTLVSAAAITKRIATLQKSGLIDRLPNPADGRGALISLTPEGVRVTDEAFPEVLAIERRLLAGLSPAQHARAVTSLRQILASAERPDLPE